MLDDKTQAKQQTSNLLNREVNRAEFIRYIGVGLLSMVGINTFFRYLYDNVGNQSSKRGYGGGAYGR